MVDRWARAGQQVRLRVANSVANPGLIDAQVYVQPEKGEIQEIYIAADISQTDRTFEDFLSGARAIRQGGFIVGGHVGLIGHVAKRGQTYVLLETIPRGTGLVSGYIYSGYNLEIGNNIESLEGKGYLHWVQEANDAAGNAVTTVNLAATNVRRIVRAILVKYHQVGGGDATITITLRDLADSGGPTNWSIASDTWVSPSLVLAANQEGLMHVDEHGFVSVNDAGSLSYADNSSAPNPFPMEVEEGDPADLIIAASGGASGDDYDVWVKYEEWIEI